MPEPVVAGADTGTTTPTAPVAQATPAAPAAPVWSLDTWKDDDWDSLPERIRTVADKRYQSQYEPKLTEAQNAIATHQREVAEAKAALRAAEAARLSGDPYGAADVRKAQADLAKAQGDFDAYRKEWNPERFQAHTTDLQRRWDEALKKGNEQWNQTLDHELEREVRLFAPWYGKEVGGKANPAFDAARTETVDRMIADYEGLDVPKAWFILASGLNAAQVKTLEQALANDVDPMQALEQASKPPAHQPSPAARAAAGGPRPPAPRPEEGVRQPSPRQAWRDAAREAVPPTHLNADR